MWGGELPHHSLPRWGGSGAQIKGLFSKKRLFGCSTEVG